MNNFTTIAMILKTLKRSYFNFICQNYMITVYVKINIYTIKHGRKVDKQHLSVYFSTIKYKR